MNGYTPKLRRVEEAKNGFTIALKRVLNWDDRLRAAGHELQNIVDDLARTHMVKTAREYAIDHAVALAFNFDEVAPGSSNLPPVIESPLL